MDRSPNTTLLSALSLSVGVALTSAALAHDPKMPMGAGSTELHKAMADGMSTNMKMTGDVDKDFAAMMVQHHQQALAMAKVEIDKGANPELKAMAQKMYDAQKQEIEDLKRFTK